MLYVFTVAFFGHRCIDDLLRVENLLEKEIQKLINEKQYVEFLVGCNGDFDRCVSSSVRRIQKIHGDDNSALVLVLPYATAEYVKNEKCYHEYYTDVEVSFAASKAYPIAAIQIRNREMADRAKIIICYITREKGGAWKTVQYAMKLGKPVINIAELVE